MVFARKLNRLEPHKSFNIIKKECKTRFALIQVLLLPSAYKVCWICNFEFVGLELYGLPVALIIISPFFCDAASK